MAYVVTWQVTLFPWLKAMLRICYRHSTHDPQLLVTLFIQDIEVAAYDVHHSLRCCNACLIEALRARLEMRSIVSEPARRVAMLQDSAPVVVRMHPTRDL